MKKLYRAKASFEFYFLADVEGDELAELADAIAQADIDANNGAPSLDIETARQLGISSFGRPWHTILPYIDADGNKAEKKIFELFRDGDIEP